MTTKNVSNDCSLAKAMSKEAKRLKLNQKVIKTKKKTRRKKKKMRTIFTKIVCRRYIRSLRSMKILLRSNK